MPENHLVSRGYSSVADELNKSIEFIKASSPGDLPVYILYQPVQHWLAACVTGFRQDLDACLLYLNAMPLKWA